MSVEDSGRVAFQIAVTPDMCSKTNKTLHGAAACLMIDAVTHVTQMCALRPQSWLSGGASRSLNVTFLRPVNVGDIVRVEGEVVHAGKAMMALRGNISRTCDSQLCVVGEHDKVMAAATKAKL